VFILLEGFIGAVLVRLELVADNTSALRAVVIALHLVNTLFLLASLALAAWSSQHGSLLSSIPKRLVALQLGVGLIGIILVSAAGAVTALGDTLFPSQTLAAGLNADFDLTTAFLLRLRVIHPVVAILTVVFLVVVSRSLSASDRAPMTAPSVRRLYLLIVLQVAAGVSNVLLLAPLWMQIIHLVLADVFWLNLVVLTAEILAQPSAVRIGTQKVAEML
jgi:heme A synthase